MTTSLTPRALVVAHDSDGPGGQVAVRLAERGYEIHNHVVTHDPAKPNSSVPFPDFADYDLVVLMGSIRSLTNKLEIGEWVHDELDRIQQAHQAGQPILGICFGGQLLADALGGSVELAPTTEIGWHKVEAVDGVECPIGPGPWMQWHHDRFEPPSEATTLAVNENATQLFQLGRSVGTQFHPEVDVEHITRWLASASDDYLAEYGQNRADILDSVRENEARNIQQCHDFVDWYLDSIVGVTEG